MSDIRFNQWLHNSGTGGVSQVDGGHVGIGTTNPLIPVGAGVTAILNVGVVTANYYYGDGSNLSGVQVGGASSLSFNDNIGAYFGNSQDLKIHHDGNHSYIDDQGTGNLRLRSGTLEILNLAGNKTSAIFSSGGGQTLNFNNNTKFVTTNTGVNVTGIVTASSTVDVKGTTSIGTDALQLSFSAPEGHIKTKNTTGSPASNLALHTTDTSGNTNRVMHLRYDGNVGINQSTPTAKLEVVDSLYHQLYVKGSSTVGGIRFGNSSNQGGFIYYDNGPNLIFNVNNGEKVRIDSSGHIGIGTINPAASLQGAWNKVLAISAGTSNGSMIRFIESSSAAGGTNTGLLVGQHSNNSYIVNYQSGFMSLRTNNAERLRIASNGNVSIGNNPTVHADTIFHIEDSGETNVKIEGSTSTLGARISLQNNDTTANSYSQYAFNDAGGQSTCAIQGINTDQTNNYGELAFLTRNAQGTPPVERLRITSSGYVQTLYNPSFRAGLNANTTFNSSTDIIFNDTSATWHYNRGNHYNTSNGRFTAPVTGVYQFNACVIWYGAPNNTFLGDAFHFYVNGGNACYSGRRAYYNTGTTGRNLYYTDHMSVNLYLNSTDYVHIRQSSPVATVHGNTYYTWFAGSFLG